MLWLDKRFSLLNKRGPGIVVFTPDNATDPIVIGKAKSKFEWGHGRTTSA